MPRSRPPFLRWLGRWLPPRDREFLLGDLEEEWAGRRDEGLVAAWAWLLREGVGVVRTHRMRGVPLPRTLMRETLSSVRRLRRRPGVPALVALTLGLGIGTVTGVLAVVDGVLLQPLDLPRAERLVALCSRHPTTDGFCVVSPGDAVALGGLPSLEDAGTARGWSLTLRREDGLERIPGGLASPGTFAVIGATTALGRLYDDVDQARGEESAVALLSHEGWSRRFGGDPEVVGRVVPVDDRPVEVVGVLAPGVEVPGLEGVEMWLPLPFREDDSEQAGWRGFRGFGLLAVGATTRGAAPELDGLARSLAETRPDLYGGWHFEALDLRDHLTASAGTALRAFLLAAGLVLLVAALNAAGLLLARQAADAPGRRVRISLGAGRGDLVRSVVVETGLMGIAGAILGVGLALLLLPLLLANAPPLPRLDEVGIDVRVLLGAIGFTGLAVALAAGVPVIRIGAETEPTFLRSQGEGDGVRRLRSGLLATQVAASVALLGTAGLLGRSIWNLTRFDVGVPPTRTVAAWLLTTGDSVATGLDAVRLHEAAAESVRSIPEVRSAGLVSASRFFGGRETERVGLPHRPGAPDPVVRWYDVGPGAFGALGRTILAGRDVSDRDDAGGEPVVWVSRGFARRYLPEEPIGATLRLSERGAVSARVVGVVSDAPRPQADAPAEPEIWLPLAQWPRFAAYLVYQTEGEAGPVTGALRGLVAGVSPEIQVGSPSTVAAMLDRDGAPFRFSASVLVVFGLLSIGLACMGLFASLSYSVTRRRREIGIRRSLGETRSGILRATVWEGVGPGIAGIAVGLVGAGLGGEAASGLRVGVGAWDPITLAATAAVVLVVLVLASWLPGRRATAVDPAVTLRQG